MWQLKWESTCTFNHTTYLMAIYTTCLYNKNDQIWIKEKIKNLLLTFLFISSYTSSQKSLKS